MNKSIDQQFNESMELLKNQITKSIRNGSLKFSPEFIKKLEEVKQNFQTQIDNPLTTVVSIDDFKKLSMTDRAKINRVIKLKI